MAFDDEIQVTETERLKKEQEDKLIERQKRIMYQLDSPPPKVKDVNEYILAYKKSGNCKFIRYFLHAYENEINMKAYDYCNRFSLYDRFADVKQIIVTNIYEKLSDFNPEHDVPFIAYVDVYLDDAVDEYVSNYSGSFNVKNYKLFKKINGRYYELLGEPMSPDDAVNKIAAETGLKKITIIETIRHGVNFRYPIEIDPHADDKCDDDDEVPFQIADHSSNPAVLYPKLVLWDALMYGLDELDPEKMYMLCESASVCYQCFEVIPKNRRKTYAEIANEFYMVSESAVQKANRRSEEIMRRELIARKAVSMIKIRFIGKEKIEDGLVRYSYAYQPDLCKTEGVIDNIYDPKTKAFWGYDVIKLADGNLHTAKRAIMLLQCNKIDENSSVFVETQY